MEMFAKMEELHKVNLEDVHVHVKMDLLEIIARMLLHVRKGKTVSLVKMAQRFLEVVQIVTAHASLDTVEITVKLLWPVQPAHLASLAKTGQHQQE